MESSADKLESHAPNQYSGTAGNRAMSERAFDIERRSFDIIESEVGSHSYNEYQWVIVRRVIHATADFDFAKSGKILFHRRAIESAFNAFQKRCTVVTDVDMVLAAINKKSITDLGLKAVCYIADSIVAEQARELGKTRSETAMRCAVNDMDGGIVAIGNAPTALYEVIKMIKEGITKPALVVGLPVGFVSATESKEELAKMDEVPFITNSGRKGGSPVVSSIMNALMLLYMSKNSSM